MQITVQKSDFYRELQAVAQAAERKTTIPVLSMVRIEAKDDKVVLTATDLETAVQLPCPAGVIEPGVILLPAKKLTDYIRLLPDSMIAMKATANEWVSISCGRSKTRIAGMAPEAYPELPKVAPDAFSVPLSALLALTRRTSFAISAEESRFTLNGCLLVRGEDGLKMVATDGHRLALAESSRGAGEARKFLIPRNVLDDLAKVAGTTAADVDVAISVDDNHLFFDFGGDRLVTARKLSGNFPDYERVIPKNMPGSVTVSRDEFKSAVSIASRFADERSQAVKLQIGGGELVVTASTSEQGESENKIEAAGEGEVLIGLNAKYMLDFVGVCDADSIVIGFRDGNSAIEMRPPGGAGAGHSCTIMPMRV
jgi:DNA polymerase-3 subunit beta